MQDIEKTDNKAKVQNSRALRVSRTKRKEVSKEETQTQREIEDY